MGITRQCTIESNSKTVKLHFERAKRAQISSTSTETFMLKSGKTSQNFIGIPGHFISISVRPIGVISSCSDIWFDANNRGVRTSGVD